MELIKLLDIAKLSPAVKRHEILLSVGSEFVHCFFEGQTDESFYGGFLENKVPKRYKRISHQCGNKDNVYIEFSYWKDRVVAPTIALFFVDKDIDNVIPVQRSEDSRIFVTSTYSIENYLCCDAIFSRILSELFRIGSGQDVNGELLKRYQSAMLSSYEYLTDITAWVLYQRRKNIRPELSEVKLGELIEITNELIFVEKKSFKDALPLLDNWLGTNSPSDYIEKYHTDLVGELKTYKTEAVIRGKFALKSLVLFLDALTRRLREHEPPRKISSDITMKNAIDLLGPRLTSPIELSEYFDLNFKNSGSVITFNM